MAQKFVDVHNLGIVPVILTGRNSSIVANRAKELGITEIHQGVSDKLTRLKTIAANFNASSTEIAYIGDDLNDLECMQYCGLTACPADAVDSIKALVDYICPHDGGKGAVRDFAEYLQFRMSGGEPNNDKG